MGSVASGSFVGVGESGVEVFLSDRVYEHVYSSLVSKRLCPGDILDRKELAEELGVSVSPVVQAFNRLEQEGFLEILPRRGTRVRTIRFEDIRATFLLRNGLECEAARWYCGEAVQRERERLLVLAQEVDSSRTCAGINWQAELAFHGALVGLTGCPGFMREYERVMRLGVFVLVSTFSVRNPFPPDPTGRWHADLVEQLCTPEPDMAESAIRCHVESGREAYLRPESDWE